MIFPVHQILSKKTYKSNNSCTSEGSIMCEVTHLAPILERSDTLYTSAQLFNRWKGKQTTVTFTKPTLKKTKIRLKYRIVHFYIVELAILPNYRLQLFFYSKSYTLYFSRHGNHVSVHMRG